MRSAFIRLASAATATLLFAAAANAQERVVHVYNWSDYIDESVLEEFTKETGIKVVYDVFDSNELLETKLLAGGSGYDVVVPTAPFLARQIQAGVFQKLDKSKLPNLKNMWPDVMERLAKYDPGNEYAVNYMWGTTGIGYNVDKVKAALGDVPVDSWDVLFKPENAEKLKSCGINILDASDETFAIALNYVGKNPDSKEAAELRRGRPSLHDIRPPVKTFNSSAYIDDLANGDICMTIGWSGDILQAKARAEEANNGVHVEYVIPKEGTYMWVRQPGDPRGRPERRRSPRVHQLPDEARRYRQGVQLRAVCERQPCLTAPARRERLQEPLRLSRSGDDEEALHHLALWPQGTACSQSRLATDKNGQLIRGRIDRARIDAPGVVFTE
jgi:Spermidine/putrescine-binding periplasmic protein